MKKLNSWLDAIHIFSKDSDEYKKLDLATHLMCFITGGDYRLEDVVHDAGAGMRWTSIMRYGASGSCQFLSASQQVYILEAETADEMLAVVHKIFAEKKYSKIKCFPPFEENGHEELDYYLEGMQHASQAWFDVMKM